jgi:hypothetical protein
MSDDVNFTPDQLRHLRGLVDTCGLIRVFDGGWIDLRVPMRHVVDDALMLHDEIDALRRSLADTQHRLAILTHPTTYHDGP